MTDNEKILEQLGIIAGRITKLEQKFDFKINSVDLRLKGIDSRLNIISEQLETINERLANIEKWVPVENSNFTP